MNADEAGWSAIRFIAHRCGGRLAPENTLEGLAVAAANGFRAVEFDAMLSGDGTPILIHDDTLDRTTDGRGDVAATGDVVLAGLKANRGLEAAWPAARIPRLDEAMAACNRLRLAMNIEIKPAPGHELATGRAVAALIGESLRVAEDVPRPIISSFSEVALAVARERLSDLPFALLVAGVPDDWQQRLRRLNCTSLHVSARQVQWDWLAPARAAGVAVRCYTVNDAGSAQALFARGIDAVFTDAVDLFAGPTDSDTNGNAAGATT